MNIVNIIGRLTKDVEVKYTSGTEPKAVARVSVAVNRDKDHTDYIPVIIFGKQAENCEKFLNKGSKLAIEGRLQSGSYEKNGSKVYTMDVVAIRIEFLDSKTETTKKEVDRVPDDFAALEDDIPF